MGASDRDTKAEQNEKPGHKVRIPSGFWMSSTEITQKAYEKIMKRNPSEIFEKDSPVTNVSWNDAIEFCNMLSRAKGLEQVYEFGETVKISANANGFRLPTEAEWEYACRGNTETFWSFGNDAIEVDQYAWYLSNAKEGPKPVALKKANAFGLFDMHGNVMEWCWDGVRTYKNEVTTSPVGSTVSNHRILRGGCFCDSTPSMRSSYRYSLSQNTKTKEIGFRIVRNGAND